MNQYEITYFADPKLDEEAKNKLDEAIDQAITSRDGNIIMASQTNAPGSRRRLHYPIKRQRVAWMRTLQIELDPAVITSLRQEISKQENVLRVAVLNTPLRPEFSPKLVEIMSGPAKDKAAVKPKTPVHKPVTMAEVEEKIEEALDEEVK